MAQSNTIHYELILMQHTIWIDEVWYTVDRKSQKNASLKMMLVGVPDVLHYNTQGTSKINAV